MSMSEPNNAPQYYSDLPDDIASAAITTLGTIRARLGHAFEQLEVLQVSAANGMVAPLEALESLQMDLADIQVCELPTLESLCGVLFVKLDPEEGVVYDQVPADEETFLEG